MSKKSTVEKAVEVCGIFHEGEFKIFSFNTRKAILLGLLCTLMLYFPLAVRAAGTPYNGPVGSPLWATNTGQLPLRAGTNMRLSPGEYISPGDAIWINGTDLFAMQYDGNLVLYINNVAKWALSSYASAIPGSYAVMQSDGNFVVYGPQGQAVWATGTWGNPGAFLVFQLDSNVVIYAPPPQAIFFVDANWGNDNNDGGTENTAWRTILHARDVIRWLNSNMTGDIVVYLRGGGQSHMLPDGIGFGSIDSGTNGYNIIYRAYPGETPVISGGVNLTGGWTLHDSGKNIYKKTGVTGTFRQLYIWDQWGVRARKPNINANGTGDSYYPMLNKWYPFEINASYVGSWANSGAVEFVFIGHWSQNRGRISSYSVSGSKATVYFKSPENNFPLTHHTQDNGYFYLENAYELLDAPGEWFHNRSTSTLYYIPRPGENMSTAQVIAPRAPMLVNFSGTLSAKVRNIRLEGITFKHNNWTDTDNCGYVPVQGGHNIPTSSSGPDIGQATFWAVPGAINLRHANNITIERCTITQGGSWGIMQQDGCDNNTFESNRFSQLASGAIAVGTAIGGISFWGLPTGSAAYTVINNNTIDQVSFYYKDAPAINLLKTKYVSVIGNTITNVPYTAISVGFEWDDSGNQGCRNNYLAYNKIYNAVYLLDDGGAVYSLGKQLNSVMEYNYASNVYASQFSGGNPVVGVFLDNGSCYWNVRNNVIGNVSAVTYANNPPVHDNVGRYNYYNTTNVGYTAGYSDWSNNYYQTSWSSGAWNIINNSGAR